VVPTVVIAAHNEAAVIGRCLDALVDDRRVHDDLEIVVAANGCTDHTVDVAQARPGVRVLELPDAGKTAAFNAADLVATGFPRLYLDADVVVSRAGVDRLCAALEGPGAPLVATPGRRLDVRGRPWTVRAFYAVQRRLPVFDEGLFGRGLVALSRAGRERFDTFPDLVADDLFLDSLFAPEERLRLPEVVTEVATPTRTRDLYQRLVRVRRGNAALRAHGTDLGVAARSVDPWSWLRDVVVPRPWLAPAAVVYVGLTLLADRAARRSPEVTTWGRDDSTRTAS
jgi:glycosyltransferase involved in cell wall biosynthesis